MALGVRICEMKKGIYTIKRWDNETFAIVPERVDVFGNIYERDSEKTKVLIFIDEEKINKPREFAIFLGYALETYPSFKVFLSTQLDAELIQNADIIIEDIGSKGFINDLENYDNGAKIFISNRDLKNIKSKSDFRSFVKMLKRWISGKSRKQEVLI